MVGMCAVLFECVNQLIFVDKVEARQADAAGHRLQAEDIPLSPAVA